MITLSLSPPFVAFILQPGLRAGAPLPGLADLFLGSDRLALGGRPLSIGTARPEPPQGLRQPILIAPSPVPES